MSKSSQLTITFPDEIVDAVKQRVAFGEYSSESEVILNSLELLFEQDLSPHDGDPAFDEWMRDEVMASMQEYRADPSKAVSLKELREEIVQWDAEAEAERQS